LTLFLDPKKRKGGGRRSLEKREEEQWRKKQRFDIRVGGDEVRTRKGKNSLKKGDASIT